MSATEILAKLRSPTQEHSPVYKEITPSCSWCDETKPPFNYVLPLADGEKVFCSKSCIAQYRKQYNKGKCTICGNAIVGNSPSKKFCSTLCENKLVVAAGSDVQLKVEIDADHQQNLQQSQQQQQHQITPITPTTNGGGILSQLAKYNNNNNNNNNVTNSSNGNGIKDSIPEAATATASTTTTATTPTSDTKCLTTPLNSRFQYESFQVFDWESYLNVLNLRLRIATNKSFTTFCFFFFQFF